MIYRNECPRGFLSHFSSDLMDEEPRARPGLKSRPPGRQGGAWPRGTRAHLPNCMAAAWGGKEGG